MRTPDPYKDFTDRLKILIGKHPMLIATTLSTIFTMRPIGNKTHADLAEIAITEVINQYMDDFRSVHVGKDLYRAKSQEENIKSINEITKAEFPVSLKAYGDGPLRLSTDKTASMVPILQQEGKEITAPDRLKAIFDDPAFSACTTINVLPLISNEKAQHRTILMFDSTRARSETRHIAFESAGRGRKPPVYRFYDAEGASNCEVRYGDAAANALQRDLWTHTKNGLKYFDSITGGWIDYSHNKVLVSLFSHALVSTQAGHASALEKVKEDSALLKQRSGLKK